MQTERGTWGENKRGEPDWRRLGGGELAIKSAEPTLDVGAWLEFSDAAPPPPSLPFAFPISTHTTRIIHT